MTDTTTKPVKIPAELLLRLKARKRPHQALAGVIEELLLTVESLEKKEINNAG